MTSYVDLEGRRQPNTTANSYLKNILILSAATAFTIGLTVGILIAFIYFKTPTPPIQDDDIIKHVFINHSHSYPQVSFVHHQQPPATTTIVNGIYWGERVEQALPSGYRHHHHHAWTQYIQTAATAVKLEIGCGRMQNRLVIFEDGRKACVRYRQNTDQIQGELFSFYLAQILQLPNLAPSAISIIDLQQPLWRHLNSKDIAAAQWHSNKPVVLTQYIGHLAMASIPAQFKPRERHLNKNDVLNYNTTINDDDSSILGDLVELAQWSDLIVFDYLTANLDRIVNNLYNYQWNANIMDAPAHNLAKLVDLLVFLDNESGLLHGYRLLNKYEVYHSLLLENLCVFRRTTVNVIKMLKRRGNVGDLLREMFDRENGDRVKDLLPTLPDKSVKILNERIERVYGQIVKCETLFSDDKT